MKYKVGDRVRIKSLDWYNENKGNADKTNSVWCADGGVWFFYHMSQYCGKIITIENVWANSYTLEGSDSRWTDEMIEGLAEEEMSLDKAGQITDFEYEGLAYTLPEGYIFKDENGNVINATKIVLEKKKKEYPKTYEECAKELGYNQVMPKDHILGYMGTLLSTFQQLLICRDAYWKIYGEEFNWDDALYYIYTDEYGNVIESDDLKGRNCVLAFPNAESRDAYKENFGPDIEKCKLLL